MAGYSGTPLPKKLGIKPDHKVALVDAPRGFDGVLGELPPGVRVSRGLAGRGVFDVIVLFVSKQSALASGFASALKRLDPAGGLWVSWPKKASGVATDVTENVVRDVALAAGLVDNKVCAVDETWSGLRCVVRLADRPPAKGR